MFLLGNLLKMRNKTSSSEEEKPFLEHLEDLRSTIVRLLITLILGIGVCFFFRNTLMEVMRKPIDGVWTLQLNKSLAGLPEEIDAGLWERAANAANEGALLTPKQRSNFYEVISDGEEDFAFHVESIIYYRSALAIKDEVGRIAYIQSIPDMDDQVRTQVLALAENYHKSGGLAPDPTADSRRRLVFMQSLHPTEGFMLSFKLALYAGIALTLPVLLYFILQFILPGLHRKEKKILFPSLVIGFGLFIGGGVFAYTMVLPRALEFFSTYSGGMGISNDWRIGEYISFTTQFVLIFGLAFELPVVVMALVMMDFLSYSTMAKSRAYAVVGILIVAAVVTPTPDALTLGLLAVPMYILYEICIIFSWFVERKRRKQEEQELAEEKARMEKVLLELKSEEPEAFHDLDSEPIDDECIIEEEHVPEIFKEPKNKSNLSPLAAAPTLIPHEDDVFDDVFDDVYTEPSEEGGDLSDEFQAKLKELEAGASESAEQENLTSLDVERLEGNELAHDPEAEAREAGESESDHKGRKKP